MNPDSHRNRHHRPWGSFNPEELCRVLIEEAVDGMFVADEEGLCAAVNGRGAEMAGRSADTLVGMNLKDLIVFDAKVPERWVPEEYRRKGLARRNARLHRPDGSLLPVEVSTRRLHEGHLLSIVHDLTERTSAEEALRSKTEDLDRFFTVALDLLCIADTDGYFRRLNPQWEAVLGYPPVQLEGTRFLDLVHPDDQTATMEAVSRLASQEAVLNFTNRYRCRDGSYRWIEWRSNPAGRLIYAAARDITDRKKAEAEQAKLQAQLLQAQKMESVGRLAGGVAHDFNNMLGVILGHTDLAMAQADLPQSIRAHLGEIQKAARRSADLTRQLLAFARKQTVSPRVLDLNHVVGAMLKMLRRLIGEDIDLAWMPGKDLWQVRIDPAQVDQIVANLTVNARDAITGVGKVAIETVNTTLDRAYCREHPGAEPGEYVMVAVSDDGAGMGKEVLDRLFEPFFTTKGVGKGTGLGLATVYGIVKQNEGYIDVTSEPGEGTSFRVYLPRYRGGAATTKTEVPEPVVQGQETILLVEDEPAILDMCKMMLEGFGYRVLAASTPGEALQLARGQAGEINLLVSDVVMPEMNGRDLARNLLSLYPNLKRLFMSGYTADVIAHHGVLDAGVHFLQKPFSVKDLAAKVGEALEG